MASPATTAAIVLGRRRPCMRRCMRSRRRRRRRSAPPAAPAAARGGRGAGAEGAGLLPLAAWSARAASPLCCHCQQPSTSESARQLGSARPSSLRAEESSSRCRRRRRPSRPARPMWPRRIQRSGPAASAASESPATTAAIVLGRRRSLCAPAAEGAAWPVLDVTSSM